MGERFSRRRVLAGAGGLVLFGFGGVTRAAPQPAVTETDLIVYGATAAGIVAAVQLRRMGGSVLVIEPSEHLGGMTTSGLGATDTGTNGAIGGIAGEFYRRIHAKYEGNVVTPTSPARFTFEPRVAQAVLTELMTEAGVPVVFGARLSAVVKSGPRLTHLVTEGGKAYGGRMFVDATYEGDLLAQAGVAFTTGREGNAKYEETLNGVQLRDKHQFVHRIDASGIPGVTKALAPNGTADDKVQAYCYRMCLTRAPDRIPFAKPAGYEVGRYELLARYLEAGWRGPFFTTHGVGGGRTDSNNLGAFSTDAIGLSHGYPTGSHQVRQRIVEEHRTYQQGLLWFLANDRRVPEPIRTATGLWGLARDEFAATGGWPPQLYVREARRMVSSYVMTEHNCTGAEKAYDSVGLASYAMDSHNCQRVIVDGAVRNEGDVQVAVPEPYRISYRSIIPVGTQCANLLVPVALSASHIAYGSLRMEPVFMILAQSAATAARQALDAGTTVQRISLPKLQARLRNDGQLLDWRAVQVVVDNRSADVNAGGTWAARASAAGFVGTDYLVDGAPKGPTRLRFRPRLPVDATYEVALRWTASANRASNVPVDVAHADGLSTRSVDQRRQGGEWVPVGSYRFAAGTAGSVVIRTDGTNGVVIADAVRFTRV